MIDIKQYVKKNFTLKKLYLMAGVVVAIIATITFFTENGKASDRSIVNVTSNNQSGGVTANTANVTAGTATVTAKTANFSPPQRTLSDNDKQRLLSIPKDADVRIDAILGDSEALRFASVIKDFLLSENYKVNGVSQSVYSAPVIGASISKEKEGNIYKVTIGSK